MNIVLHHVDLGDVEVCPNLLLDKLILVCMKAVPRVFEPLEGVGSVGLKVCIVNEIKDSAGCSCNFRVGRVGNDTKENLLHVLVFISSPLGDERNPLLKMAKAWVPSHCLEMLIDLVLSISKGLGNPFD